MSMATGMGSDRVAFLFRITAILPLFWDDRKGDTEGMHPYFASRIASDREDEFRHRAETYRLLAEVSRTEPRSRRFLGAFPRRAAHLPRSARRRGSRTWWPIGRPVARPRGLC